MFLNSPFWISLLCPLCGASFSVYRLGVGLPPWFYHKWSSPFLDSPEWPDPLPWFLQLFIYQNSQVCLSTEELDDESLNHIGSSLMDIATGMPLRHIKYHKWKFGPIILPPKSVFTLISNLLVQHLTWISATNLGTIPSFCCSFTTISSAL